VERVPETSDVLASYEIEIDNDGNRRVPSAAALSAHANRRSLG
jgi:hypothetical protein